MPSWVSPVVGSESKKFLESQKRSADKKLHSSLFEETIVNISAVWIVPRLVHNFQRNNNKLRYSKGSGKAHF